jgi:hypothetical protein
MSMSFHESVSTASLKAGLPLFDGDELNGVIVKASIASLDQSAPDLLTATAHSIDNSYPIPESGLRVERSHLDAIESTIATTGDDGITVGSIALLAAITSQRGQAGERMTHDQAIATTAREAIVEHAFNEETANTYSGLMARFLIEGWAGKTYSHSEVGFLIKLASEEADKSVRSERASGYVPYVESSATLVEVPKYRISQDVLAMSLASMDWVKTDLLPLSLPAKLVHGNDGAGLIVNLCDGHPITKSAEDDIIQHGMHAQALRYVEHSVMSLINNERVKSFHNTKVPIQYKGNAGRNHTLLRTFSTHLTHTAEGIPIYGIVGLARTKANELKVAKLFTKNRLTNRHL